VKEVTTRRSFLPMVVMLSSLTILMGAAAVSQRAVEARAVGRVTINEPVLQEMDRVARLLETGHDAEAKRALDVLGALPLPVDARTSGDGALTVFSPSTLLMRTGRAILARADAAAVRGDRSAAMGWIERCRELSGQVLATPNPNMDTLNLARYLDKHATTAEIRVLGRLHETEHARLVAMRGNAIQNLWQNNILARVRTVIARWNAEDSSHWNEKRDRVPQPSPEVRDARYREEQQLASDLIRLYQSQRSGLRVVENGSDKTT
jgi:hypothetical protein